MLFDPGAVRIFDSNRRVPEAGSEVYLLCLLYRIHLRRGGRCPGAGEESARPEGNSGPPARGRRRQLGLPRGQGAAFQRLGGWVSDSKQRLAHASGLVIFLP